MNDKLKTKIKLIIADGFVRELQDIIDSSTSNILKITETQQLAKRAFSDLEEIENSMVVTEAVKESNAVSKSNEAHKRKYGFDKDCDPVTGFK